MTLATAGSVFCQEAKENPADTVKHKYLPTGLRLGTDVISLIKSNIGYHFQLWEVNADVDLSRYYFTVDYGNWSRRDSLANGYYQNKGHYFRVGGDVNFLLKDPDKNMFFIGFRYGRSGYNEALDYSYTDTNFGIISKSITESGLQGHWVEITTGLRVKIWSGFWMGYTARIKFAPGVSGGDGQLTHHDIPGYGLAEKTTYWGFNYQLFWRIPLRTVK